jgi:hypothetical protein
MRVEKELCEFKLEIEKKFHISELRNYTFNRIVIPIKKKNSSTSHYRGLSLDEGLPNMDH